MNNCGPVLVHFAVSSRPAYTSQFCAKSHAPITLPVADPLQHPANGWSLSFISPPQPTKRVDWRTALDVAGYASECDMTCTRNVTNDGGGGRRHWGMPSTYDSDCVVAVLRLLFPNTWQGTVWPHYDSENLGSDEKDILSEIHSILQKFELASPVLSGEFHLTDSCFVVGHKWFHPTTGRKKMCTSDFAMNVEIQFDSVPFRNWTTTDHSDCVVGLYTKTASSFWTVDKQLNVVSS